jgi:hypothetical protein
MGMVEACSIELDCKQILIVSLIAYPISILYNITKYSKAASGEETKFYISG